MMIELKPIVQTLGIEKIAALPAFHALSGADNRKFFWKGRACLLEVICTGGSTPLSLPLQNLGEPLIRMKKLSNPLRSLSVFISTENNNNNC